MECFLSFWFQRGLYIKQGTNGWLPVCRDAAENDHASYISKPCSLRIGGIPRLLTEIFPAAIGFCDVLKTSLLFFTPLTSSLVAWLVVF